MPDAFVQSFEIQYSYSSSRELIGGAMGVRVLLSWSGNNPKANSVHYVPPGIRDRYLTRFTRS